ncbi:MAG: glycosyltransferase family 1 protein [Bacteroidetes bacterium]|nr:glycosyltransferase family 1 protein [Bacteroidota bacterium]
MKYGIITTGSRGDVQPFVALALSLMDAGHDVTLVAPENFAAFVQGFGIPYLPITGDSERIINTPAALKLLEGGSVFKFFYHLQKITARTADQSNQDILDACSRLDNLIVSVLPLPIVYSIAEKYHKKCAVVFLSLPPLPTREFPFQAIATKGHPWLNKLSYRLLDISYLVIGRQVNRFRKQIGLPPKNVLKDGLKSNTLAITTISPHLIKQPADWPPSAHLTGFFYIPSTQSAPNPALEDWLKQGDRPIYIGFGSIPVPNPPLLLQILETILPHKRIILATGWTVFPNLPTHPNLFTTKYTDHSWLLPQCSTAIIHGGIGTIAAILRAGIPSVVVSILADQPINGKLIEQKHLGFHIPFKKLTPTRLQKAIDATQNPQIINNCKAAAAAIQKEDGLKKAVHLIENYFEKN